MVSVRARAHFIHFLGERVVYTYDKFSDTDLFLALYIKHVRTLAMQNMNYERAKKNLQLIMMTDHSCIFYGTLPTRKARNKLLNKCIIKVPVYLYFKAILYNSWGK